MSTAALSPSSTKSALDYARLRAVFFPHWAMWALPSFVLAVCALIELTTPRITVAHQGYLVIFFWFPTAMVLMAWRYFRFQTFDWFLHRLWGVMLLFLWINYTINAVALFSHMMFAQKFPDITDALQAADVALGFNWNAYAHFMHDNYWPNLIFSNAYADLTMSGIMLTPIIALMRNERVRLMEICFLMLTTALSCVSIAGFFPAFAATDKFADAEILRTIAATGHHYLVNTAQSLHVLRESAHVVIDPRTTDGLVCFPSFHCCMALIIIYSNRGLGWFSAIAALVGLSIIAATPVYGGHYVVDVIVGAAITGLLILVWRTYFAHRTAPLLPGTSAQDFALPAFFKQRRFRES